MYISEVSEGEKGENEAEVIFEEIMTEKIPKQISNDIFQRDSEP